MLKKISYIDVLNRNLKVMDSTAISLCMDNKLPLHVLNIKTPNSIADFLKGKNIGTLINSDRD